MRFMATSLSQQAASFVASSNMYGLWSAYSTNSQHDCAICAQVVPHELVQPSVNFLLETKCNSVVQGLRAAISALRTR